MFEEEKFISLSLRSFKIEGGGIPLDILFRQKNCNGGLGSQETRDRARQGCRKYKKNIRILITNFLLIS